MATSFSAGPQSLGYLYQARYALLTLLQSREECTVILEGLDDIEKRNISGSIELEQLKHHVKKSAVLTNSNEDLWKTLRIWSTYINQGKFSFSNLKLGLVTTATAPPDSIGWYLKRGESRNEEKARELLLSTISKSRTKKGSTLWNSFQTFKKLSEYNQKQLLRCINILDNSSNIIDVQYQIKQEIRHAAPPNSRQLDHVYEQLEGWWFGKVVDHLINESKDPISLQTVEQKIWSLTKQLQEDKLPITYSDAVPDSVIDPINDDRLFVHQLRLLNINMDRIKVAILDYYKAFEQRASWVRHDLLLDDEIHKYEKKLIDEWHIVKLRLLDDMTSSEMKEDDCIKVGRDLLRWVEAGGSLIYIRPSVDDRFIIRGSYHILADREESGVYWHPQFLARLEEIFAK